MQPLPRDFLTQLARKYELSLEQEEAFVELYSRGKKQQEIAQSLHISDGAFRTRMSGVYKKFSIGGWGPGKTRRLHDFLITEYQKYHPGITPSVPKDGVDIDELVKIIRRKVKEDIQERCGKIQVLDMTQSIGLCDIYTDVNILEKITGRIRLSIADLMQGCNLENFDRFGLGKISSKRVPGLEAVNEHRKLMVWGKPGSGKTTFLKYLAMQCIGGQFQNNRVPIFITLKDFADQPHQPDLEDFIKEHLAQWEVTATETTELIKSGRALILLDGLDEVRQEDSSRVLNKIQQFCDRYRTDYFVITCRIAAREYTFQGFTEVEVADFNARQIETFAQKWFKLKDPVKAEKLIKKLKDNEPIKELATNPLLLTLLCLVFGEIADFPANRSELYEEGIDVLLKKWDVKRNIERDRVYQQLSLKRKEDLLSQIAEITFKNGDYFFKQRAVEGYIADYIENLPGAKTDPEALQLDSEAVLKSIEAQHGLLVEQAKNIYSFSHLTFHEYFTAREIVSQARWEKRALLNFVSHLTEKRWREVFLLAVGMQRNADSLLQLMKQEIDRLVEKDEKIQEFLSWAEQKSTSVDAPYKPAAIRAFYLSPDLSRPLDLLAFHRARDFVRALNLCLDRALAGAQDLSLAQDLSRDLDLARDLARILAGALAAELDLLPGLDLARDLARDLAGARDLAQYIARDYELVQALQKLQAQLPDIKKSDENFKQWWKSNSSAWIKELRGVIIKHRNIDHNWQFNQQQVNLLNQYLKANKFLVDCLNSDCYVSRSVREEIETNLLLPVTSYQLPVTS